MEINIDLPRWAIPLQEAKRFKFISGGRASGKSHERAEALVERMICEPDLRWVCAREIQKSLKYSSKQLIEDKIRKFKVSHLFDITLTEIKRKGGEGVVIFMGLQDHTADSIKSLEGFDGVWVEEAQSITQYSIDILVPTIRKDGSELWFTWNPKKKGEAVERLKDDRIEESIHVHVNYYDNPLLPEEIRKEAEALRKADYEKYLHIWEGQYDKRSKAQVFMGCYDVKEFDIDPSWAGPYQGIDFGFSQDPTVATRSYIDAENNILYISHDFGEVGLPLNDTAEKIIKAIPEFDKYRVTADSARPESINHLKMSKYVSEDGKNYRLRKIEPSVKGKGSVEDGIEYIKSFSRVIIHSRCKGVIHEFETYSYKEDKITGEIQDVLVDENNHYIDSLRYALEKARNKKRSIFDVL